VTLTLGGRDGGGEIARQAAGGVSGTVGMRRVALVRVVSGRDGVRAEAVGTGHRLPVTRAIPLATAMRLAAQGVPLVLRDEREDAAPIGEERA
jgi:hypothetical protein